MPPLPDPWPCATADGTTVTSLRGFEPPPVVDDPRDVTRNQTADRPHVHGKFLFVGDHKLHVRGVTYGTFAADADGEPYPPAVAIDQDFALMAAQGINAVRTYTVPPQRLLDAAHAHGLRVLVGLAWEQHIAFLDDSERLDAIESRLRAGVRACARHPAVLAFAIGNEIPAAIVRWHGAGRVERFLERLYRAVKVEDPGALVTYVNFPTTEYLHLPFLDFVCFNVYLEHQGTFARYLARLHHVAGDRPLVMTELGLDSRSHGVDAQARALDWQVRTAFSGGCAGAFVFAWSDTWHRGGQPVEDWDFGLLNRRGRIKPALTAVRQAFAEVPFPDGVGWPRISVVVCSRNGARTIRDCFEGLRELRYPDVEVIVVDDGSTDDTAAIAAAYDVRLISTENHGLSSARNRGLEAATGEIVAYLDDDARPDPDWLTHLAATFMSTPHAGVGGPNITPPSDGPVAACVANAPGGPIHVLLSDLEAEHIPGCNMAFRRDALQAIGGFDPLFRAAGDDVDVCWRLQDRGWTLGFSPAAMVWHHRRGSLRAYWRQQLGYGHAEALLEQKWPERYNRPGHLTWAGRLYTSGRVAGWRRGRIYQGMWGSAPFQSLYEPAPSLAWSLPAMPEWHLGLAVLGSLSLLGLLWAPLLLCLPLFLAGLLPPLAQAILGGRRAVFPQPPASLGGRFRLRAITAWLHAIQPIARLHGRLRHGLTPWRRRSVAGFTLRGRLNRALWSETWRDPAERIAALETTLRDLGAIVSSGGDYDRWDLEVRCGTLGAARVRTTIEEHGGGRQLFRVRSLPHVQPFALITSAGFATLGAAAAWSQAPLAGAILAGAGLLLAVGAIRDCGAATAAVARAAAAPDAPDA